MPYTMIVEQTKAYPKRMRYISENNSFVETQHSSLAFERNFSQPYGWIKESGTPPLPHWDVILMTDKQYELGDQVSVKIIGVFKQKDGDHKYIVVEETRNINDFEQLNPSEKSDLNRLYPIVNSNEGFHGKVIAERVMLEYDKAF